MKGIGQWNSNIPGDSGAHFHCELPKFLDIHGEFACGKKFSDNYKSRQNNFTKHIFKNYFRFFLNIVYEINSYIVTCY